MVPSKTPISPLTFPIFSLSLSSSFLKAWSKLRLCCMCTVSPYPVFFSLCRTHAPSLTAYRGLMGAHEIVMCFRPFYGFGSRVQTSHVIFGPDTPRPATDEARSFFNCQGSSWFVVCWVLSALLHISLSFPFLCCLHSNTVCNKMQLFSAKMSQKY